VIRGDILAIDPGPEKSWWVAIDAEGRIIGSGCALGERLPLWPALTAKHVFVECPQSRSFDGRLSIGRSVLKTAAVIGQFLRIFKEASPQAGVRLVFRPSVTSHWLKSVKGGRVDSRQAFSVAERFKLDGPKEMRGTKKAPGPCFGWGGVGPDGRWDALALALYARDELLAGRQPGFTWEEW
jgi:hypothetical protein